MKSFSFSLRAASIALALLQLRPHLPRSTLPPWNIRSTPSSVTGHFLGIVGEPSETEEITFGLSGSIDVAPDGRVNILSLSVGASLAAKEAVAEQPAADSVPEPATAPIEEADSTPGTDAAFAPPAETATESGTTGSPVADQWGNDAADQPAEPDVVPG